MSRCTAPVRGHRTASGREAGPACGGGYSGYSGYSRYGGYGYSSPSPSYAPPYSPTGSSGGGSSGSSRPRWSKAGSSMSYTPAQVQSLTPIREAVVTRAAAQPDLREVFLCHAWDDRQGQPNSCTICSRRLVSKFGSARRTLASACR